MGVLSAVASRRSLAWLRVSLTLLTVAVLSLAMTRWAAAQPAPGEVVIAWHVTIAPSWFDPSTAPPQITPFGMLYALHDALVRPLPGQKMGNALAESWTESPDGLRYEFKLRRGLKFHNGDPVTTEDVKFSFERYKGAGREGAASPCAPGGDRRSPDHPLPPEGALARLHDVLRNDRHRGRARRPQEVPHPGRGRRLPQASHRRRPVSIRQPQARGRGRARGESGVLAPRALRQAGDHEERARRDHARGDAEERRGRHRLRPRRRGRREREAGPAAQPGGLEARVDLLDRVRGPVGSEVSVGRQADAAGRQLCAQPQGHQRGGVPGLLPAGGGHRPARHGLRAAGAAAALRPRQGQAAPRRGRLSEGDRRRRVRADRRRSRPWPRPP